MKTISSPQKDEDLPELKPGDLVAGRFRIVEIIGSGGFSVVYRAHQEGMNRFIALKVLKPRASDDDTIVERFRREALFASQLSHPNTITLFDYGQTGDGLCYIAMEYLEGYDLSEEVKYGEPVALDRVWSILTQVCRSLAEAHQMGLIHRDLKPENIFLVDRNDRNHVKVLDFGVSKALSSFGTPENRSLLPLTQKGTVFGTPLYMAPEQALAEELTPAVDVYALGHIAFEMITGRAAYIDETSSMDVMLHQINDPPLKLTGPHAETPFADLVWRCTVKDVHRRLRDASALLDELLTEPFMPYMDDFELPPDLRKATSDRPVLQLPVATDEVCDDRHTEEVYRWELDVLDEALESVAESAQMRLVVIRGKPGTGRSNLLRAFLARHRDESGLRIVHRQAFLDGTSFDAGLEADLAQAAGLPLLGEGIKEVNRLLAEFLGDEKHPTLSDLTAVSIDSNPLGQLSSRRDDFFSRLIEPFRRATRVGTLIWGIENLESVDPLTLAFLERFIRELRVHPSPILLAITVHPDALVRRPGLTRYAEYIVNAPSTYARHLRLMKPGTRKPGDEIDEKALQHLSNIPSDLAVDGSFAGVMPTIPDEFITDQEELERWSALADGRPVDGETSDGEVSDGEAAVVTEATPPSGEASTDAAQPAQGPADTDNPSVDSKSATQRLELFTSDETSETDADLEDANDAIHEAFDTVLGYLAQLDERVISRELWDFVYHRVLPFEMTRVVSVVLEYAERFGIITLTEEAIAFTDQDYANSLRETFEEKEDATESHAELAALLQEFAPRPERADISRIVHHAVNGEEYEQAIDLLLRAGNQAYEVMDLDLAREYYLQFQGLTDELSTLSPPPPTASEPHPEIWLRIGEIQGALGEFGAAEDALRRALEEAGEEEYRVRAAAHKLLGDLAVAQERYTDGLQSFERARDLYQQTSLARPYVASLGKIGWCSVLLGRPRQAERILLEAIDKAKKLKDLPLEARFHRYMGEVLARQARYLESIDHLEDAMEVFEEAQDHRDVITCLNELGQAHFAAGHYRESRDACTRALAYLSRRHLQLQQSPHLGLARALAAQENLEQAEIHLVEAMSHYSTRNQPVQRARVQFHLGDLYLAMGRAKIAEEHFGHVFDLGCKIGQRELAFDSLIRRAYAYFDHGDEDRCFSLLSEAVEFSEDTDDSEYPVIARTHIIYLQLLMQDFDTKAAPFSTMTDSNQDSPLRVSQVLTDFFHADVAVARQAYPEAASLLTSARVNAASLGAYALFIPIARREYLVGQHLGRFTDPHLGAGYALGTLIPPESGRRRFSKQRFQ